MAMSTSWGTYRGAGRRKPSATVGVPTVAVEEIARKVAQQIFHSRDEDIADEIEDGAARICPVIIMHSTAKE